MTGRIFARVVTSVIVTAAFAVVAVPPAQATFPGQNGKIVFEVQDDIFTVSLSGVVTQLTTRDVPDHWPVFSPDGRQIVYASGPENHSDIRVMRSDGSHDRKITEGLDWAVGTPAFMADGRRVVFASTASTDISSEKYDLFVMRSNGKGKPRRLTHTPGPDAASNPVVSPDGKVYYFYQDSDGIGSSGDGYVINANGKNPHELFEDRTIDDVSPDGQTLVVSGTFDNAVDRTARFLLSNPDGSNIRPVVLCDELNYGSGFDASFAPNGSIGVFVLDSFCPERGLNAPGLLIGTGDLSDLHYVFDLPPAVACPAFYNCITIGSWAAEPK